MDPNSTEALTTHPAHPGVGDPGPGSRFFGVLTPLVRFFFGMLLALSLCRAGLVLWQLERVRAVDGVLQVMGNGLRMDVIAISAWVALGFLLSLVFAGRHRVGDIFSKCLRVYLTLGALFFLFMEVSTPSFMAEYDTRPNRLFFEYLVYPREVFSMLLKGYKLELLITLVVSVAVTVKAWRLFGRWIESSPRTPVLQRLGLFVLLAPLLFLGLRSSLRHRPANPSSVAFSQDSLVNALCLSSAYSVGYAVYQLKDEVDVGAIYGRLPRAEVLARVRTAMGLSPSEDFPDPDLPTLHRQVASVSRERPYNLVIVLEESLGAQYVGELGGLGITPRLDELAHEGWWFDSMYATGTRSVRGIEAVVAGFQPTPARSVVKLGKSQSGFFTLAELLRREGYRTQFIYGGESHFDNMRSFFVGNGFEEIVDQDDYEDPVLVGSWGVSDEDIFAKAHEMFLANGDDPFFALVFSVSNHSPFEFPDGRIELVEEPKASKLNTVKYADHAVGEFILKLRASEYGSRTIVVVVADHDSRVYGAELVPIPHFHIPAVILGPQVPVRRDPRVASQIDLGPTLLALMGLDCVHPMTGHDLTRLAPDAPGRAIMQYGRNQAYMVGNDVVVLRPELEPVQFQYIDKSLVPAQLDPNLAGLALAHALLPSLLYFEGSYRLPPVLSGQ